MAKVICKAVDYSFIIQDDKIVILNIPPSRKALPEDLHIRVRNKKMIHGLLLITEMTFVMCYFISEESGIGGQNVVHNFILKNGESYTFGHFEGNTINSANCLAV